MTRKNVKANLERWYKEIKNISIAEYKNSFELNNKVRILNSLKPVSVGVKPHDIPPLG